MVPISPDWNWNHRKHFYMLKGRNYIQFLPLVGVAGFEPAASWTRTKRDTKLRHTPIAFVLYSKNRFLSRGRESFLVGS